MSENDELVNALAFFRSVIKSGEPWTDECEGAFAKAAQAIERLEAELADANEGERKLIGRYNDIVAELAEARAEIERKDGHIGYAVQVYDAHAQCRPTSLGMDNALVGLREALAAPAPEPHRYKPSYQHMGDCKVCGHLEDSPLHDEPAPERKDDTQEAIRAVLKVLPRQKNPHPDDDLQKLVNLACGLLDDALTD